jgi:hypothetical protein
LAPPQVVADHLFQPVHTKNKQLNPAIPPRKAQNLKQKTTPLLFLSAFSAPNFI